MIFFLGYCIVATEFSFLTNLLHFACHVSYQSRAPYFSSGGKKRSQFFYDIWNIKYLSKFKWDDLTEETGNDFICIYILVILLCVLSYKFKFLFLYSLPECDSRTEIANGVICC